jgi:hypothetical protein
MLKLLVGPAAVAVAAAATAAALAGNGTPINSGSANELDPLIYTPGDDEWTDCHRPAEGNHNPLVELASIRDQLFPTHGVTMGGRKKQVLYQADAIPENLMWEQSKTVFVDISLPGSNNDLAAWGAPYNTAELKAAQAQEVNARTTADLAWLDEAFAQAEADDAQGVVIFEQADMWDPTAVLTGYTQPVAAAGNLPATARVVVQGGADNPIAWLKVTVAPRGPQLFTLENVQP